MQGETKYGRVPQDIPGYLTQTVEGVRKVASSLPASTPSGWRQIAYGLLLEGILRDHADNGAALLEDQDFHDLRDLMLLSADVALAADVSLRDETFTRVLAGTVDDWVQNWNADGQKS